MEIKNIIFIKILHLRKITYKYEFYEIDVFYKLKF